MSELFPGEGLYPPGFSFVPGFLTTAEEETLLAFISTVPLRNFMFQGFEAKRKTASYGYDYHFDRRKLSAGEPIPEELNFLIKKVGDHLGLPEKDFAEALITEYPPGAVINWHRDAPPFGTVAGISLLSGCIFKFRPHDKDKRGRGSVISLPVGRRSLYVISGESRELWEHSIAPVMQQRYSITLRTLR
jgi:alkylated DNA repair dioxygenase AlkB